MIGLIKAETVKLTGRRLLPGMTVVLLALVGLLGFVFTVLPRVLDESQLQGLPAIEKPDAYLFGVQQVVGQTWFPLILGVVVFGGELASTIWATTLTRESRRSWQIGARILVFTVASWLAMLVGVALWVAIAAILADGAGGPAASEWLGVVWKVGITQIPWIALGLGLVSVLRSVGPAIGAVLALSFGEGLLALWRPYQNVSLTGATSSVFGGVDLGAAASPFVPEPIGFSHAILILAGWSVFGLLLTWWGLSRRDA